MDRRTLLKAGRHGPRGRRPGRLRGAVGAGANVDAATAPAARARARRMGPDHPHHGRVAPAPPLRLRVARRPARRHHRDPQLRTRRLRHVALLGHGPDGGRNGSRPRQPPGGGHRVRSGGPHRRPPVAAARVRGDHLRHVRAAQHDLEHVVRGLHTNRGTGRGRAQDTCLGRPVPRSGGDLLSRAAVAGGHEIRRVLDRPLRAQRHASGRRRGGCRGGAGAAVSRPSAHRRVHPGTRGASLSQPLRDAEQPTAHRAVHLPGCAGSRLHRLRRAHRDPQVHRTARAGGAERAAGRQLQRTGGTGSVRRRRAAAGEGTAHRARAPGGGRLEYRRRPLPTGIPAGSSASTCSRVATASSWGAPPSGASGRRRPIRRRCGSS